MENVSVVVDEPIGNEFLLRRKPFIERYAKLKRYRFIIKRFM